jgi:hypothetical protein
VIFGGKPIAQFTIKTNHANNLAMPRDRQMGSDGAD